MERHNYSSGSQWEENVGYSRAVKKGPFIEIAGTTASNGIEVEHLGDAHGQTNVILKKITHCLDHFNAHKEDVVRMRIFVKFIEDWPEVTRAFTEHFGEVKPALTLVQSNFIHPDLLVEIEASAIVS